MTQPQDANSILMGSGSPAFKFDQIGTIATGTVVAEPTSSQQTDFRTKVPETWPDGSPKMQVLVQMSTTLRDPQKPEDDGTRTLYIKGKELTTAVRNAVRASGANGIHTGGQLTVQYVADGQAEQGLNPPKLYVAQYQPPAVSFAGVTAPQSAPTVQQPVAQQQYAAPVQQQPAAQAPAQQYQQPVQQVAQQPVQQGLPNTSPPPPPGVDPGMWSRLTPAQQQAVAAAQTAQAAQPAF